VEDLLRTLAPQVLAALVRRHGSFEACEDAVQEALLAASQQWPSAGVPDNPRAWLVTVATRRLTDEVRSAVARRTREDGVVASVPPGDRLVPDRDDSLALLLLCCHPSLTPQSQVALTLRAVGGLTTAEIAAAFLVPEATMAQRISRAKATIRKAGAAFELPDDLAERLTVVAHVLYLIFNEGYTASSGESLRRDDLAAEAIRLTRMLRSLVPDDAEVAGLLALMLLTHARRDARVADDGALVALADQDRSTWDAAMIAEGIALVEEALARGPVGPFQLQAAIAAVHAEAPSVAETDWRQVLALYGVLAQVAPGPVVELNRAVAVAEVHGPAVALDALPDLPDHHRWWAVRAHLLERAGDVDAARDAYREAARRTSSLPERRYLYERASCLST
jgi:RNA polymerase sigma factor (sigma-70 family)